MCWITFTPPYSEGAGKTGCTLHPRSRVRLRTENAHASRALVLSTFRVHRIPPHVRDDRDPPLYRSSGIFFRKGLDRFLLICPTGKLMEGFAVLPSHGPHISGFCRPLGLLANDLAAQPAEARSAPPLSTGSLIRYHAAHRRSGSGMTRQDCLDVLSGAAAESRVLCIFVRQHCAIVAMPSDPP